MARADTSLTVADLRRRIGEAKGSVDERARRLLLAWFDTAARGVGAKPLARALRDGTAAVQIAEALRSDAAQPSNAACAKGCAFCCILDGPDGGTITADEASRLHAALSPLPERPMAGTGIRKPAPPWTRRRAPAALTTRAQLFAAPMSRPTPGPAKPMLQAGPRRVRD